MLYLAVLLDRPQVSYEDNSQPERVVCHFGHSWAVEELPFCQKSDGP